MNAADTEVIDWWSYAADNYRITSDAASAFTAAEPRWVVAEYEINDEGEYVYDALTEPMTLWEAQNYEQSELAVLIAEAESTDDYQERERIISEIGPLIREQIKAAALCQIQHSGGWPRSR
jgi:hypothetical protein